MKEKPNKDGITPIEQLLKLTTTKYTNLTNMHLFNKDGVIKKYSNVYEIVDEFYDLRVEFYVKRKAYILDRLKKELTLISYKMKFINEILHDTIDLRKKKKAEIESILEDKEYPRLNNNIDNTTNLSYDYLIKMPLDTLTEEKVEELERKQGEKQMEYDSIFTKTEQTLWVEDLRNTYATIRKINKKSPTGKKKTKANSKSKAKKPKTGGSK